MKYAPGPGTAASRFRVRSCRSNRSLEPNLYIEDVRNVLSGCLYEPVC